VAKLLRNAPSEVIEGSIKIRWTNAETANAILGDGDVLVVMRHSPHREENVAHALMAYLPKAVLPRARRYVDGTTMEAADLVIAKSLLGSPGGTRGAVDVFFDQYLDPQQGASSELADKVQEVDQIDLHGWLTRVLLPEFRRYGNLLHPGNPNDVQRDEARRFFSWLHELAIPYDGHTKSLDFRGTYLRVSVMFVAERGKLDKHGLDPYRRRAKRMIYEDRVDALYLMARDTSIPAVISLAKDLAADARVADWAIYEYPLRSDFEARILHRDRAVCCVLRRRDVGNRGARETQPGDASEEDASGARETST
jgi:hypothetical protein